MLTRKLITAAILTTGIAAFAGSAYATPIGGTLDINGIESAHTATSITFVNPAGIDVSSGDFNEVGLCVGCVTMGSPFSTGSALPFQLFTATNNGNTVTFHVTSDTFTALALGGLQITGTGIVSLTGFDDTLAEFSLTVPHSGRASFDLFTAPEPGSLALFGAALLGCALFLGRRRLPNV